MFLVAGLFFGLTAMTYAEGASLHPERGGSAVFARYAFNELVSFVAGWAIFLDYTILIAVTALTVPSYLAAFAAPIGRGGLEIAVALAVIAVVAVDNLTGVSARRLRPRLLITVADLILQALIIVLGLALVFDPHNLTASIHLGTAPTAADLAYALPIAVIAFTGIEAAASIAGEVSASRKQVKLLVGPGSAVIVLIYVGISLVGVGALPVHDGMTALGTTHIKAPVLGAIRWWRPSIRTGSPRCSSTRWRSAAPPGCSRPPGRPCSASPGSATRWPPTARSPARSGACTAMGYPVRGHRRGRAGRRRARAAHQPRLPGRHLRLRSDARVHDRARLGDRAALPRAATATGPTAFRCRSRSGAPTCPSRRWSERVASALGWVALLVFHSGARYVGLAWLLGGLVLYVVYRKTQQKPLLRRVTIPERALRYEALEPEFGSILVPILGTALDDDIIQTAGRLAGETRDDLESEGAMIEAIWVFEIPLALPMDAPLARRPGQAGARGAGAGQAGGGGVRGRRGGHRDRARPPRRRGDRARGAPARGRGDRAGRRGVLPGARRLAARRAWAARSRTTSATSPGT